MTSPTPAPSDSTSILLRKLAVAGTGCLWIALVAGFCGRWAWPLDLFAHFRVQYAVLFGLLSAVLFAVRLRKMAVLALLGVGVSAGSVLGYAYTSVGWQTSAAAGSNQFRFVSFNTWFRNRDHSRLLEYLEQIQADVVVLQEITPTQAVQLRDSLHSYPHLFADAAQPHGAVVLSRWPIESVSAVELTPDGARAAMVEVRWRDSTITIVGVHLHWPLGPDASRLRNLEMAKLATLANAHVGPLLIGGDFNTTPWSPHFQNFVTDSRLQDCARDHALAPTWPAQVPPLAIRIDQCLASSHWRVLEVKAGPYLGSDHRPTIAELELQTATQSTASVKKSIALE